ncbi:MAG: D-tyrosyl-tRNA(Tyr) deacylase [Clostridia bacterium]|nr:D-tyrosyl-tRNA(Tyr) deacylase [Clostridia bacterium]MBO7289823.1 D-tyrosyl-tRNA(Tyr) deacylase [Clostridia bacterium]
MRIVIQRVKYASVTVDGNTVGKIDKGIMALIGFKEGDDESLLKPMAEKMTGLRIFKDEDEKMNLAISDVGGEILAISQFTLYADCRKGKRPSFTDALKPDKAEDLYNKFVEMCNSLTGKKTKTGIFGADMKVELLNDGPVTIILDSDEIVKR